MLHVQRASVDLHIYISAPFTPSAAVVALSATIDIQ